MAKVAGVSTWTVSSALRNNPRVKEETRQRVKAVARNLGYRPNALARALALQRSDLVALVVPDITNPFYGEIVRAVQKFGHSHNYNIVLGDTEYNSEDERAFIKALMDGKVEGFIIQPEENEINYECFDELNRYGIPFVLLRDVPGVKADCVMPDNEEAAYMVTRHLINLGYRDIVYVGSVSLGLTNRERLAGYRRALREAELEYLNSKAIETQLTVEEGYKVGRNLLEKAPNPRAIIAFNDVLAVGILAAAKDLGRKVPDDLAVVGFGDTVYAAGSLVPLTTVDFPKYELGIRAIELLDKRIRQKREKRLIFGETQHIKLRTRLIIRESCGAALRGSAFGGR
ncbi:MAG: LacI family DNA-binding transcriptional regulator [bacterium]